MAYWLVYYLSAFSPLLPITIGFNKRNTLLWYYAIIGFAFDILFTVLMRFCFFTGKELVTSVAQNTFLIVEFILISLYYQREILQKKYFYFFLIPVPVLFFLASIIGKSNIALSFLGGSIFDFTCIFYAISGFYTLLKKQQVVFLDRSAFFWVNVAFLVYCCGNFFIFLFSEYLIQKDKEMSIKLWIFHNILNIIFSILIAISFSKKNTDR